MIYFWISDDEIGIVKAPTLSDAIWKVGMSKSNGHNHIYVMLIDDMKFDGYDVITLEKRSVIE